MTIPWPSMANLVKRVVQPDEQKVGGIFFECSVRNARTKGTI
jgi:hypothetical protein